MAKRTIHFMQSVRWQEPMKEVADISGMRGLHDQKNALERSLAEIDPEIREIERLLSLKKEAREREQSLRMSLEKIERLIRKANFMRFSEVFFEIAVKCLPQDLFKFIRDEARSIVGEAVKTMQSASDRRNEYVIIFSKTEAYCEAKCLSIPDCVSNGATDQEALQNLMRRIETATGSPSRLMLAVIREMDPDAK